MIPILASLLLAIPLSVFSSRVSLGRGSFDDGLFCIPEELDPPKELADTKRYNEANQAGPELGFMDAVTDPATNALAQAFATGRHRSGNATIESSRAERLRNTLDAGAEKVNDAHRMKLLDDPVLLSRLHRALNS
jgi:membrane glycosyltransferase